jgi:ATP-binding cassette subfamily B protein
MLGMQRSSRTPSTLMLLLTIWLHLARRRRLQLGVALIVMLASGLAEVMSLASVVPFLAVLSNPQSLWQLPLVQSLAGLFGISDSKQLLLPVVVIFGFAALLAAAVRLFNLWLNGRLSAAIGSDLSSECYLRTLYQPYTVHLQQNSSVAIAGITNHINQTVMVLNATLQLATSAVVVFGLLVTLLAIAWLQASTLLLVFGAAYGLLSLTVRRQLLFNSSHVVDATENQLKVLQEGLGAIRDVLLDGTQVTFVSIYRQVDIRMRLRQSQSSFLAVFPRYAIEALGLVLIAMTALLLSWKLGDSIEVIQLLGALALGSQRLLPALQQCYASWACINASHSGVLSVLEMLAQPLPSLALQPAPSPLALREQLRLQQLTFRYAIDSPLVIKGISLEIRQGERVGLIGSTGSGKSTLTDLLMGLLEPTEGRIEIDGVDLHDPAHSEHLMAWRASIAHVPQNIFLVDGSVAENIAFGVPRDKINLLRVHNAAQQAQIASFIESSPDSYDTFVGERGIRLSGGQRQRIGIARALYKNAEVLILDEATSALDQVTERCVMEAMEQINRKLTLVIVAHRLSTVARCDRVIELKDGKVCRIGPPEDVLT